MIVLRIGHTAATVVAAVAGFVKAIGFMPAQTMIVLRVPHTAAIIIAAVANS